VAKSQHECRDADPDSDETEHDARDPKCVRAGEDGHGGDDDGDLQRERALVAAVVDFRTEFRDFFNSSASALIFTCSAL